jgi:hypothetical protein
MLATKSPAKQKKLGRLFAAWTDRKIRRPSGRNRLSKPRQLAASTSVPKPATIIEMTRMLSGGNGVISIRQTIEISSVMRKKTALPSTLFSAVLDAEEPCTVRAPRQRRGGIGQRQDGDGQDIEIKVVAREKQAQTDGHGKQEVAVGLPLHAVERLAEARTGRRRTSMTTSVTPIST